MKEFELRECAKCDHCGKLLGETGLPIFWRVTIERFGIDAAAVSRQQGLAMLLGGNAALAQVMGPDEEMTVQLIEPRTFTVCEPCSQQPTPPLILYVELGQEKAASGRDG